MKLTSLILLLVTPATLLASGGPGVELADAPSAVAMRAGIAAESAPPAVIVAAKQVKPTVSNKAGHSISPSQPTPGKLRAAPPQADGGNGSRWAVWTAVAAVAGAVALGVWQATKDVDDDPEDDD